MIPYNFFSVLSLYNMIKNLTVIVIRSKYLLHGQKTSVIKKVGLITIHKNA